MKNQLLRGLFAVMLLLTATVVFAQPGGGGGGQGQGGPPPVGGAGAPVDRGAIGLLFAVTAYAYYQLKQQKENTH